MQLSRAISNLWAWLSTWIDEKGGVHGYTVHHHFDNLRTLTPDLWTQVPTILGLLRLFQKIRDKKLLNQCLKLSNFLVNNYNEKNHMYLIRNHGDPVLRGPGLIQPALASYALLEVSAELRDQKGEWEKYYFVAKDNVENYILTLWDKKVGALRNPLWMEPGRKHTHNMNSIAMLALMKLSEIEEKSIYMEYAEKITNYILACQVKKGELKGAIPYRNCVENNITLYTQITLLGLFRFYEKTSQKKIIEAIKLAVACLDKSVDQKTMLICHYQRKGFPQWIPDTLLFILAIKKLEKLGIEVKDTDSDFLLSKILERQFEHGGFPLSVGFEDIWRPHELPSKPYLRRWRDVLPTPNWNAWNFWTLSEILEEISVLEETGRFPVTIKTDREEAEGPYLIKEDRQKVLFLTEDNTPQGIFRKTSDIAMLCRIIERDAYWRAIKPLQKYPKRFLTVIYWFSKYLG